MPFSVIRRDGTFFQLLVALIGGLELPPSEVPEELRRASPPRLPEISEPELAAEQHLGECARTISYRDYASPGRFVFWRAARRSMVTNWARVLSCMLSSTRNCLSV